MIKEIERPYFPITIHYREGDADDEAVIREMFEENVYRLEGHMLPQGGIVLDIGANIGAFTLLTLKLAQEQGKRVTIFAIEPEKNNLELLYRNINANPRLGENGSAVVVIESAVSDFNGTASITNRSGSSRLSDNGQKVDVIKLDDLLRDVDKIDFTKIDIEGSEVPLITGANKETLLKSHYYAIEFDSSNDGDSFLQIIKPFVNDFSFQTWGIPSNGCNIYLENHHWSET